MELPVFQPSCAPLPRPAEYVKGLGWIQDGWMKVKVKKPSYHFVWPKDGKNGGKWGRVKDIFTGKGPDIHLAISANKRDYMANRQRKATWARHTYLDDRYHDYLGTLKSPFPFLAGSRAGQRYDFLTRTYRRPDRHMVTDAIWYKGLPRKKFPYPGYVRDMNGCWWQHNPWAFNDPTWICD